MSEIVVAPEDPQSAEVEALLGRHLDFAYSNSPHANVHALDSGRLAVATISFFGARIDGVLLGVGALKQLEPHHGEIKSMHTAAEARGKGIARAVLRRLMAEARSRGCTRVSLETGSTDAFIPALSLYAAEGFEKCGPFADYPDSGFSTFMTIELAPATGSPDEPRTADRA